MTTAELSYAQYVSTKTSDEGYSVFPKGCLVWLRDDSLGYRPARVLETFERGSMGRVQLSPGNTETKVSEQDSVSLIRMNEQSLHPIDDMAKMKELNHPSILHNLRIRFESDRIHTKVGSVLVSMNPHQVLKTFSKEFQQKVSSGAINCQEVPHIYCVAETCYKDCLRTGKSQSCIITGETGSGKTEAAKSFVDFLVERCVQEQSEGNNIKELLGKSGALIQAFGNAKTSKNPNSSRFGLWTETYFKSDKTGVMTSAWSTPIMLEKTRVTSQVDGEQNFHVFQQICAAATQIDAFREKFTILPAQDYRLLNAYGNLNFNVEEAVGDWNTVLEAMDVVGISESDRDQLISVLVGILHLGNIAFGDDDTASVSAEDSLQALERCCKCLGVPKQELEKALCVKTRVINGEEIVNPYTPLQSEKMRDAIIKSLYCNGFHWVVSQVNRSMSSKEIQESEESTFVGVLDIFGFESFEKNRFEQLCINYCNEKLQFFFNQVAFLIEQAECKDEGIDSSAVQFVSNEPCIKMFDGVSSPGLLGLINDQTALAATRAAESGLRLVMHNPDATRSASPTRNPRQGSPRKRVQASPVLATLVRANAAHPNFRKLPAKSRKSQHSFAVIHFAGEVTYDVNDFLTTNSDVLDLGLLNVVATSTLALVSKLATESFEPRLIGKSNRKAEEDLDLTVGKTIASVEGKRSPRPTILGQLRAQFDALMARIETSTPHFVKCIEPNDCQKPNLFDSKLVLKQMRYAGLLELCRIRQVGFPVRLSKGEFLSRYRGVLRLRLLSLGDENVNSTNSDQMIAKLTALGILKEEKFKVGDSKIMLKYDVFDDLETARDLIVNPCAVSIQSFVRGWLERRDMRQITDAIQELTSLSNDLATRPDNDETRLALEEAITSAESCLPHGGANVPALQAARSALLSSAWTLDSTDPVHSEKEAQVHASKQSVAPETAVPEPETSETAEHASTYGDPEAFLLDMMTSGASKSPRVSPKSVQPSILSSSSAMPPPAARTPKKVQIVSDKELTLDERLLELLSSALDSRDLNALQVALDQVESSSTPCGAEVNARATEAEALLERLQRERDMVAELQQAASESTERDLIRLQTAIATAQRMHMTPEDFPALQVAIQREHEVQELRKKNSNFKDSLREQFGPVMQELSGKLFGGEPQNVEMQAWDNAQQAAAAVDDLKAEIQQLAQGLEELSHQATSAEKLDLIRRIAIRLEEINPRIQQQALLEKDALCAQLAEMVQAKELELAEKDLQLSQQSTTSASAGNQSSGMSQEEVNKKLAFAADWARKQVDKANAAAKEQLEKAKEEWEKKKKDEILALRNELDLSKSTVVNGITERLMMEKAEAVEDERRKLSTIRSKNVELNLLVKKLQNEREEAERKLKSFKKQQAMLGLAPDVGPVGQSAGNRPGNTSNGSSVSGGRQRRDSFSSHGTSATSSSRRRSVAKLAKKFLGGG